MITMTCDACGQPMRDRWHIYDVRVDYRRLSDLAHTRVWHLRTICQACAEKEWDAHDNPSGAQQGALFS